MVSEIKEQPLSPKVEVALSSPVIQKPIISPEKKVEIELERDAILGMFY